jgi:GNAT superfamily N-acetyltransferase
MRDLRALRPAPRPLLDVSLEKERLAPAKYRELYLAVGAQWLWRDRLVLSEDEIAAHFASANVQLWILRVSGEVAGYFELQRHAESRVEIVYFGLISRFFGLGLGGWLLTRAIEQGFAFGAAPLTLHTCTLDSPRALPNYLARGFTIAREEEYEVELDAQVSAPE